MRMTVQFWNGAADAVLLAVGHDRVRVVVAGRATTEEWLVVDGRLRDEYGRAVEIETVTAVGGIDYSRLGAGPIVLAVGAGGGAVD